MDFKLFSANYNDYFVDSKPFFATKLKRRGGEEGEEEGVINFYYLVKVLLVRVATEEEQLR